MSATPIPIPHSRDELHTLLRYYGETGQLCWRVSRGRVKTGAVAGTINSRGYSQICLDGVLYQAHRLIFKMLCNQEPEEIDHLDGVRDNNRIGNLCASTNSGNQRNKERSKVNTSGEPCVTRHRGKWQVQVCHKYYGYYDTMAEAVVARDNARQKLGGFTNRDLQEAVCA